METEKRSREENGDDMIPFDFEYYRPDTVKEAAEIYALLDAEGKTPVYYGGGTELISMARVGSFRFGSVIDIKNIPECKELGLHGGKLVLGSAVTLSDITESGLFPLLGLTASRIADHTIQGKITLGGNLASTIIYRETSLPLLLADARLTVADQNGLTEYDMAQIFQKRLLLPKGSFLVNVSVGTDMPGLPFFHVKKTKNEKIDYPLITAAGLKKDGLICVAFSGLASFPFRDAETELILNNADLSFEQRAEGIAEALSGIILEDMNGSALYRKYVLKDTVVNILKTMKDM
jgi:CO/xanthine dehydrogenase FAD-binding subunit